MSDELKPCPFCGFGAVHHYEYEIGWCVICAASGCTCEISDYQTQDEATAAWNKRQETPAGWKLVPTEATPEMIEAAERDRTYYGSVAANHYRAMVAAAPQVNA